MPEAVKKHQLKKARKKTANAKSTVVEAMMAASLSLRILDSPKWFTIGSACSGWCSELFACKRLQCPFIPVFACDINDHCRRVTEKTWGHAFWYDDCCSQAFLDSPYVDIFLAGFPCQPWSRAGRSQGEADAQGRGGIIWFLISWLSTHLPKVFLLENVRGILDAQHCDFFLEVLEALRKISRAGKRAYTVSWQVLNALDSGTPQHRERVMIVGLRLDDGVREMSWPKPVSARASIYDYLGRETEGDARFPGRLPTSATARQNVEKVLRKLQAEGRLPLQNPFVIDVAGSRVNFAEGYSPCITRSRGGSGGHWLTWKQRMTTYPEVLKLMDVDPALIDIEACGVSPRQIGLMAGNAIPVKMLSRVLRNALRSVNLW